MKNNKTPTMFQLKLVVSRREALYPLFVIISYQKTNFSHKTINAVLEIRGPVVSTGAGPCCYSTKYRNLAVKILKGKNQAALSMPTCLV